MERMMIGTTFALGSVSVITAIVALFRESRSGGAGHLKLFSIEIQGTSGAVVFLLVGAVFVLSGFGWATTRTEAQTERTQRERVEGELADVYLDAVDIRSRHVELINRLQQQLPADQMRPLLQDRQELMDLDEPRPPQLSPQLRQRLEPELRHRLETRPEFEGLRQRLDAQPQLLDRLHVEELQTSPSRDQP